MGAERRVVAGAKSQPRTVLREWEVAGVGEVGRIVGNGTFAWSWMVGVSVSETTLGPLVANRGYDKLVMPAPVFIGDTLRASTTIAELKDSKSRPQAGIVTFAHEMLNQRDEVVCKCLRLALVKRKPD